MLSKKTQGLETTVEEEDDRMSEAEDKEECRKMLSSEHVMAHPVMNSQQTGFSAQDPHKIEPAKNAAIDGKGAIEDVAIALVGGAT